MTFVKKTDDIINIDVDDIPTVSIIKAQSDTMFNVILLSANNNGAGKTTHAKNLEKFIRELLPCTYVYRMPLANFAKTQYKNTNDYNNNFGSLDIFGDTFKNRTCLGKSGREYLKDFAEQKCSEDPLVWCKEWYAAFMGFKHKNLNDLNYLRTIIIVEDIRKVYELAFFRRAFSDYKITHKHFISEYGQYDADFPDTKIGGILEKLADKVEYIKKE